MTNYSILIFQKWRLITATILMLQTIPTNSYRVLGLFPHPGLSHFHFFHPLMRGMAEKGHEVTVLSYFPDKNPVANYTHYDLTGTEMQDSIDLSIFESVPSPILPLGHFIEFYMLHYWGTQSCEVALKSDGLTKILSDPNPYDVIIMEQFNSDCMMGVAHLIKAPVIALSSCAIMPWHYHRIGTPHIPSYMPISFLGFSEEMSFFQRLANWLSFHLLNFLYRQVTQRVTNGLLIERFGNSIPDVNDLVNQTNLLFINQHYSLSGVKPLSPAVIDIGGMHIKESRSLPEDIKQILDSAKDGVIYISWGSLIRAESLSSGKRDALLKVIGGLEQIVLWKFENDTLANQPKNLIIRKWMPQSDILCHPNVKVFMSHGGLLGSSEAAYCGVPVVSTPIYGDQFLNSAALQYRGMGFPLPFRNFNEETIRDAIFKALDPKARENAKVVSLSYKNRPQKPLDTAIWWVEHVARTKGSPLTRSASIDLPWYYYYSLDVYGFLFFCFALSILSWTGVIRYFCLRKNTVLKDKLQ